MMPQSQGDSVNTFIDGLDILGRPFVALRGAQEDEGGDTDNSTGAAEGGNVGEADDNTPDENGLTAGGRRLIDAEREASREAKRALAPWRKLERDYRMSAEQIREALDSRGDVDKQIEQVRREAETEAMKKVNARLIAMEVKAQAAAQFADPEDAHLFLDLSNYDVDEDGNVDVKEIQRDLADLLKRKPHLSKRAAQESQDMTDLDGGSRTPVKSPASMTQFIREAALAKRGQRL